MRRPPGPFRPWVKAAPTPAGLPGTRMMSATEGRQRGLFAPSRRKANTVATGRAMVTEPSACAMVGPYQLEEFGQFLAQDRASQIAAQARVERVAQPVADEVERGHRQQD